MPHAGLLDLRKAVAGFHGAHPDEVLITTGSQGALFALFQAARVDDGLALHAL